MKMTGTIMIITTMTMITMMKMEQMETILETRQDRIIADLQTLFWVCGLVEFVDYEISSRTVPIHYTYRFVSSKANHWKLKPYLLYNIILFNIVYLAERKYKFTRIVNSTIERFVTSDIFYYTFHILLICKVVECIWFA